MVLVVDDNKAIAQNIIDELDLDDIEAKAVHNVDDFLFVFGNDDFKDYSHIVMDYNLEDRMSGVELIQKVYEKYQEDYETKIYLFSGNISYISKQEQVVLTENGVESVCKTEMERLIEDIIDSV